jgi:hypothetical protein
MSSSWSEFVDREGVSLMQGGNLISVQGWLTWMKSWITDGNPSFLQDVKKCSFTSIVETQEKNFGVLMVQAYGKTIELKIEVSLKGSNVSYRLH